MAQDQPKDAGFIGRVRELDALRSGLADALAGRGRLWLLTGEAGIGKTRLAEELASQARRTGATVLWGVCWEGEGAPAFWPWMQTARTALRTLDEGPGADVLADARAAIAPLVAASTDAVPATDSAHSRFAFFEGVASFWRSLAERGAVVLLFDDLHWADEPSIRLLEFVARATREHNVLIVGTFRDVELLPDAPLTRALDGLAREGQRISLRGLAEQDLARLIEATAGAAPSPHLVSAVYRLTEGNPFFAGEITRLLAAQGQLDQIDPVVNIPPGVRETVRRRLARLSGDCRQMLSAAAVIGREFTQGIVERVAAGPAEDRATLLSLLTEAMTHRIITPSADTPGGYAFSHALVRETLYEELGTARTALHRRVGEALEQLCAFALEPHLAELAHHFLQAAPTGTTERAIDYATRAARAAAHVLAYEDAAQHYRAALHAVALRAQGIGIVPAPPGTPVERQRAELLIDLADMLKRGGDTAGAHETALTAAATARQANATELLARAALAIPWQMMPGRVRADVVALLEEALNALPPGDSTLCAGLLARLAAERYFDPDPDRRLVLSQQAVAMARRLGDATVLALALNSRHWALWSPDGVDERLAVADEIVRLAEQTGDRERAFIGRTWRIADLLELGDIATVDREIETCRAAADVLRQPQLRYFVTLLQAMRALLAGRFADGERLAGEALSLGAGSNASAGLLYGTQLAAVRRAQGRLAEIEAAVMAFAPESLHLPGARCTLAFLAAALGRRDEARAQLDRLAAHDFTEIPRDGNWLNSMEQLVQVCAILRDDRYAPRLYELLAPYATHTLVIGAAGMCYGSIAQYLGILATLTQRWTDAARHFEEAMRVNLLLGARPALAHTQHGYAEMLLAREAVGDRMHAIDLLEAACAAYESLEMSPYLTQARQLLARARSVPEPGSPDARATGTAVSTSTPASVFRRHGEYWDIHYAGSAIRLRDSRGLLFLGHLLRHPGREFHVTDLARIADPPTPPAGSASYRAMPVALLAQEHLTLDRGTDACGLPDSRAKAAYRVRLEGLRRELDEAERFNDAERASRVRSELEFLTTELAQRYQLPGHASQTLPVERMRKAVSNRIRATLTKLQREHPALSRHLYASVKLGTFCSYQPDPAPEWSCD